MTRTTLEAFRDGSALPDALLRDARGGIQMAWTDEAVAEVLEDAKRTPGVELVVSIHRSHGAAATVRLRRLKDPRWTAEGFTYRTRQLGRAQDANRPAAVTVTYRPNEEKKA